MSSEFNPPWVLHFCGLVPHLCKSLEKERNWVGYMERWISWNITASLVETKNWLVLCCHLVRDFAIFFLPYLVSSRCQSLSCRKVYTFPCLKVNFVLVRNIHFSQAPRFHFVCWLFDKKEFQKKYKCFALSLCACYLCW